MEKQNLVTKEDLKNTEEKLTKKIEENTRKLDEHTRKLDEHTRLIEENSRKIDNVALKVIENTEAIEDIRKNMVTKEIYNTLDEMMVILKKLDQERIFTTEWIRRIEGEVETHTREIKRIKEKLSIS